jgi:hypothetical protein
VRPGPWSTTMERRWPAPASSPPTTAVDLSFPAHDCYNSTSSSRDLVVPSFDRSGRRWPFPAWFFTLVASHRWLPRVSLGPSFHFTVYFQRRRVQTHAGTYTVHQLPCSRIIASNNWDNKKLNTSILFYFLTVLKYEKDVNIKCKSCLIQNINRDIPPPPPSHSTPSNPLF